MQIRNYNSELKIANIMFASLFRNFRITRSQDLENKTRVTIDVPVVIADRSRIFKNLEKQQALQLPMIPVQHTGITIAANRITNLHNEIKNQEMEGRTNYDLYTPTPIDLQFKVCLVSRWLSDIDMMLGQILPFFNTDVYVSHRHPKYSNVKYSSQVVMGTDISISSEPEIGKDADEIHTAELSFTYKTHIFGGTQQAELGAINPYVAPITKIGVELHAVPYLEPDDGNIPYNQSGHMDGHVSDINHKEMTIENYIDKLDDGQIPYPEYEQIDWILDYERDPETGQLVPVTNPNEPFGYVPEAGDGLTFVAPRHRLYDQEVEITPDHMVQTIQSQNYVNQWGLPYKPIETRPWNSVEAGDVGPTEEELQAENPMGTDDYTPY